MNTTAKTPKNIQKYLDIIESGIIAEREIISMKSLMGKSKDAANLLNTSVYDSEGLTLSPEQNIKGYDFLMDQWVSPSGKERKNNPFGYREQGILKDFSHFTLRGFYDNGNAYSFYLPIYECHSKMGNSFEYYYNGEVNIIG